MLQENALFTEENEHSQLLGTEEQLWLELVGKGKEGR